MMLPTAADRLIRRTVRIGVTGLARAGKTAFLTSVAGNLLALGAGFPSLPVLSSRLNGSLHVTPAPAGAELLPRFDIPGHLSALATDPPHWPERTGAASLLALDVDLGGTGLLAMLPPRRLRLEFLDYPGEWLLDLPLLTQDFSEWSESALRRLERPAAIAASREFLAFLRGLPSQAPADETLAATGHRLYAALLHRLRDEARLSFLQPGRFLMPAPGPEPPWVTFFPWTGRGALGALLRSRFDAYVEAVRRDLVSPLFGDVDRLVVLADLLSALHAGEAAMEDAAESLGSAAAALRWRWSWSDALAALTELRLPPRVISRVAFAATKADHVADRQRGNLASLVRNLTAIPGNGGVVTGGFAIASVRCTEDFVWTLEGRPVSAVRGRVEGDSRMTRSYPGEVPDRLPDRMFWNYRFLELPQFEPAQLPVGGRGGVPQINLDSLLLFLLEDVL